MRYLEWLFPIHRYVRRGRDVRAWRVVLTVLISVVVQWFAVHVFLSLGTTAHTSLADKVKHGLTEAVACLQYVPQPRLWRLGSEEFVLPAIFMGSLAVCLLLSWLLAWSFVPRRTRHRRRWRGPLTRFILLSSQTWALWWVLGITCLPVFSGNSALFGLRLSFPAVAIIFLTAWQAAKATAIVCDAAVAESASAA